MSFRRLWTIATLERRFIVRQRWFWLYSGTFAVLSLALAATALTGSGYSGMAGLGRTTASLLNLVMLVIPLVGLTSGALSLAADRDHGTLAYLLAQPVSRAEVFWGKLLGQAVGLGSSLLVGFGLSGLLVGAKGGPEQATAFVTLLGFALVLLWTHLALGFFIATLAARAPASLAVSLLVWVGLTFLADVGLLAAAAWLKPTAAGLFYASLANPVQVFRLSALLGLGSSLEILGPVGLYLTRTWGDHSLPLLLNVLVAWSIVPAVAAFLIFHKRNLV